MAAVLPLCSVDLARPWSGLVTCSDASLSGYAVAHSSWGEGHAEHVGSTSERLRFRARDAGPAPRARALAQA
eukprot:13721723-Alexandrium_andersonii.AAC.1